MNKRTVIVLGAALIFALLVLLAVVEIGPDARSAVGEPYVRHSPGPVEPELETDKDDDRVAPLASIPKYGRSIRYPVEWSFDGSFETRYPAVVRDARDSARSGSDAIPVIVRSALPAELKSELRHVSAQPDAFQLRFGGSGIEIVGVSDRGAVFGVTELLRLLEGSTRLPKQRTFEHIPHFGFRGVHISMNGVQPDEFKYIVWLARNAGMNTLIVQPTQGVKFESLPGSARDGSISVAQFRDLVRFARENGLDLVPELKTLTHQEKVLRDLHPGLMLNSYEYDPRNSETYDLVFKVIDEILEVTGSKAMHIGHDEIVRAGHGGKRRLRPGETTMTPEMFLQDLLKVHGYLRSKDVEVWMWGDMLLDPETLPSMNPKHLNGDSGYAKLLPRIPRDIVVFDWHYFESGTDFPSLKLFTRAGFRTVPSTWRQKATLKSFAEAARLGGPNVHGMLATTWFHVQRREWSKVERIINESGEVFWSRP